MTTTYAELQEEIDTFQTILEDIASDWANTETSSLSLKMNEDLAKRRNKLRVFLHKHSITVEDEADRGI